jgi:hypothetical protein
MWRVVWAGVTLFALFSPTRTGREYFNELKDARAFNRFNDEYVCFRDDDAPSFIVLAKIDDMMEQMTKAGKADWIEDGIKILSEFKGDVMVETYRKGVSGGRDVFEVARRDNSSTPESEYSYEYAGESPGRILYSIHWTTGRYRLKVYSYGKSKVLPVAESSGKCELIRPSNP